MSFSAETGPLEGSGIQLNACEERIDTDPTWALVAQPPDWLRSDGKEVEQTDGDSDLGWFASSRTEADAAFLASVEDLMIEADELSSSAAQCRILQNESREACESHVRLKDPSQRNSAGTRMYKAPRPPAPSRACAVAATKTSSSSLSCRSHPPSLHADFQLIFICTAVRIIFIVGLYRSLSSVQFRVGTTAIQLSRWRLECLCSRARVLLCTVLAEAFLADELLQ